MALDLPWMWMLDDGERLYLEVDEKLNPQDGRCALRLVAEPESGAATTVRTWLWAFLPGQALRDGLAQLFPWAQKAIDVPWYRQHTVADFLSEHGRWLPEEAEYELSADFNVWFGERFAAGIAPYATSQDGTTAFWRLELALNAVGRDALEKDKLEMLDLVHSDANARDRQAVNRASGYYELRSIDATYSAHGYFDHLVFVNGEDEEGLEDLVSLRLEPRLMTSAGDPEPALVDEILRHARGTAGTAGLVKAFSQRFAAEFDADDGIPKIQLSDIDAWFEELKAISVDESDPAA
jgi:hypothetical protein